MLHLWSKLHLLSQAIETIGKDTDHVLLWEDWSTHTNSNFLRVFQHPLWTDLVRSKADPSTFLWTTRSTDRDSILSGNTRPGSLEPQPQLLTGSREWYEPRRWLGVKQRRAMPAHFCPKGTQRTRLGWMWPNLLGLRWCDTLLSGSLSFGHTWVVKSPCSCTLEPLIF